MIPPDELESFRSDLIKTLRIFKRVDALDLGQEAFLDFAEILDDKREFYDDLLEKIGNRARQGNRRTVVRDLNESITRLSRDLKGLARVVKSYREPTGSGGATSQSDDLRTMQASLEGIESSIETLASKIVQVKKVLWPGRGGTGSSGPVSRGQRPYRSTLDLARVTHRRLYNLQESLNSLNRDASYSLAEINFYACMG
jgi:archaellum component FlaC